MKISLAILAILLAGACVSPAIQFRHTSDYFLGRDDVLDEEAWIVADRAVIRGTVLNDAFVVATTVTVSGTLERDLWAAGDTVVFTGRAADDVRLAARLVEVDGSVDGNLSAAGTAVTLQPGTVVQGDALLAGENVVVRGKVRGNVRVYASTVTLNADLGGNVRVAADDIVVMPGTRMDGDFIYSAPKDLFLDPKVTLAGQLVRKAVETPDLQLQKPAWGRNAALQAFFYVCAMLVAIPFVGLFPHYTGRAVKLARQHMLKCTLAGLVGLCLIPLVAIVGFAILIGIPLGLLLMLAYGILLYLSKIVVALAIGGAILRRHGPQPFGRALTALSLGLILLYAAAAIPAAWFAVWFVVVLVGFGALLLALPSSLAPEPAAETPPAASSTPPLPPSEPPQLPRSPP